MSPFATAAEWWSEGSDGWTFAVETWRRLAIEAALVVEAQYRAAEEALSPALVSAAGRAAGVDAWDLWRMHRAQAERYASEELRDWWRTHGRLTVTGLVCAMWRDELEAMSEP